MRRLVTVLVLGLGLVVGGCGSSGPSPLALITAAPLKTTETKTAKLAIDVKMTGTQAGKDLAFTGDGAADFTHNKVQMNLDMSALGFPGLDKAEMLLDGTTIYMKVAALSQQLGGKPWLKIDLEAAAKQAGVDLGSLSQLQQADPSQALDQLRGVTGEVTKVGEEKVRGEDTTHYRATVDLNKAKAKLPADQQANFQKLIDATGMTTYPVDVWIDGDGRARRQRFAIDLSKATPPSTAPGTPKPTGTVTTTLELFDFGTDVSVNAPSPDQVTDLSSLLGQAQQGG